MTTLRKDPCWLGRTTKAHSGFIAEAAALIPKIATSSDYFVSAGDRSFTARAIQTDV